MKYSISVFKDLDLMAINAKRRSISNSPLTCAMHWMQIHVSANFEQISLFPEEQVLHLKRYLVIIIYPKICICKDSGHRGPIVKSIDSKQQDPLSLWVQALLRLPERQAYFFWLEVVRWFTPGALVCPSSRKACREMIWNSRWSHNRKKKTVILTSLKTQVIMK